MDLSSRSTTSVRPPLFVSSDSRSPSRFTDGNVVIQDTVRGCKDCASYMKHTLCVLRPPSPRLPSDLLFLSGWFGQVIYHDLNITYGLNGSINYLAKVSNALRPGMLRYSATGDMGSSASLKVCLPLLPGCSRG